MATQVLRPRGDESAAHINQLFHNMRIGAVAPRAAPFGAGGPHAQQHVDQLGDSLAQMLAPAALAPPAAHAQAPVDAMLSACHISRPARPLRAQVSPLAAAHQPAAPHRPPSPDSRYLITNWAAVDEVEEELAFMMSDLDLPQHDLPQHELSYIS